MIYFHKTAFLNNKIGLLKLPSVIFTEIGIKYTVLNTIPNAVSKKVYTFSGSIRNKAMVFLMPDLIGNTS